MEHATLVTIPTIVHLMVAEDTSRPEHNKDVNDTREVFPKIFASADHEKSVNAIWKPAKVQFKLDPDRIDIVTYHLKDFGTELGENEQILFKCSSPPTEDERQWFRDMQEKFGSHGFQGLQVFVLARISSANGNAGMGGCAISQAGGVTGSAWLDAPAVMDDSQGFFRPMAHEIGHFLSLPHVQIPNRLMNPDSDGRALSDDELERAHNRAVDVMKTQ